MRVFCKIQEFPGIDIDEKLCDSVNWLVQNQRADGALPEVNMVIHREMVVRYAHFPRGRDTGVNFCWVCAADLAEPLPHYSLFCGHIIDPILATLRKK